MTIIDFIEKRDLLRPSGAPASSSRPGVRSPLTQGAAAAGGQTGGASVLSARDPYSVPGNAGHWLNRHCTGEMRVLLMAVARLEIAQNEYMLIDRLVREAADIAGVPGGLDGNPELLASLLAADRGTNIAGIVAWLAGCAAKRYGMIDLMKAARECAATRARVLA